MEDESLCCALEGSALSQGPFFTLSLLPHPKVCSCCHDLLCQLWIDPPNQTTPHPAPTQVIFRQT